MPIRHGGRLASRASTWPRDHLWRSIRAPRRSWPTMWNEFLPISMPITATLLSRFWDMTCSFVFGAPLPVWRADRAGARPDHPIRGPSVALGQTQKSRIVHSAIQVENGGGRSMEGPGLASTSLADL